jgi:integrase
VARLHTETACRRGGAVTIQLADLDPDRCLICFHEKGDTVRWQPITPNLAASLVDHAAVRGAVLPTDRILRYRNGRPLTTRGYDTLWKRLPWIAAQGISTHWLRHTTLTWVERHFGYGVARAYAGHTDSTGPATTTYIKASLQEVATHPLALPPWTLTSTTSPATFAAGEASPIRTTTARPVDTHGWRHPRSVGRREWPGQ